MEFRFIVGYYNGDSPPEILAGFADKNHAEKWIGTMISAYDPNGVSAGHYYLDDCGECQDG